MSHVPKWNLSRRLTRRPAGIYCTCSAAHGMLRPLKIMPRASYVGLKQMRLTTHQQAQTLQRPGWLSQFTGTTSVRICAEEQATNIHGCLQNSKKQGLDYDATLDKPELVKSSRIITSRSRPFRGRGVKRRSLRQRLRPDSAAERYESGGYTRFQKPPTPSHSIAFLIHFLRVFLFSHGPSAWTPALDDRVPSQ